ncbi:hypothetical protein K8R14_02620 [bacterium]|nr:hypothetical protein [bacterium]
MKRLSSLGYILVLLGLAVFMFRYSALPVWARWFAGDVNQTSAKVNRSLMATHESNCTVYYSFSVGEVKYEGSGEIKPDFESGWSYTPPSYVGISYSTENPGLNYLTKESGWHVFLNAFCGFVLAPILFLISVLFFVEGVIKGK